MGFYGNITNTSKTTFSFDLIYDTRVAMDENADIDGVFLGRYVLIDYDEEPIKAYYNKNTDRFYNTANFSVTSEITPRENIVYQDLHNVYDKTGFYKWDSSKQKHYEIASNSPYQERFTTDVKRYGRGYDSTVWVKRYNTATNKYKYAMIAELNAVVPTLHLVVDKPTTVPTTPYFDRDTTNIDYYLHMQSDYGAQVKQGDRNYSDEEIMRTPVYWAPDDLGYPSIVWGTPEKIDADIYYNKAGFEQDVRTYIEPNQDNQYTQNSINYSMAQSGRLYGADADLGVYEEGLPADDIYEWYFRLPALGNTVCSMWDKIYGYREDNKRYLNKTLKRNDTADNLVTYDKQTLMGMINTTQDLLGYHFVPFDDKNYDGSIIVNDDPLVEVTLNYENNIPAQTVSYHALDCLFYNPNDNIENIDTYYHYAYNPDYIEETGELNPDTTYYYKDEQGIYHFASQAHYKPKDADGKDINPIYHTYYTIVPRWEMKPLAIENGDTIYGILAELHQLLGTNANDVRDVNTVRGSINIIKDILSRIDLNLAGGRLMHTDNSGMIETTDTFFPSASWDRDEVLAGDGQWVSRFASVKVRENSENSNRKLVKVVEFEDTDATSVIAPVNLKNLQAELVSDNQLYGEDTELKNYKAHDPNTLIFATRDKWIKLHPDAADDSIEFEHTQSPIVQRLSYQEHGNAGAITSIEHSDPELNSAVDTANFKAIGTEIVLIPDHDETIEYESTTPDKNDNRLTIPYITVDNAGHVVAASTKNYNIPHGFKKVRTDIIADTNESGSEDKAGISIAETISDTLYLEPQNRWIDIATVQNNNDEGQEEDKITFGHRLVPGLNDQTVKLNGDRRTSAEEIPTVYRFGLPQDKDISALDEANGNEAANTFNIPYIEIDKAGHVVNAETHTVEIPDNYTTITVGEASVDNGTRSETGLAGVTSDSLAGAATLTADTLTESLAFNPSNKWIRIKGANTKGQDTIEIGHELHNIIASESSEDLDTVHKDTVKADKFTTQTLVWDNAGHIISHNTKTWTLPNSIRNIGVTGTSESAQNPAGTGGVIEADVTSDTVTMSPSNKWIRMTTIDNDLTFGHLVQEIPKSTYTTNLNESNENEFTTQELTYDEAGHIRDEKTRTIILPSAYETIAVTTNVEGVSNLEAKDAIINAANTHDKITYSMGNKWVVLAGSDGEENRDSITFGHLVQDIPTSTSSADLDNNDTFDLYDFTYDEAGHIRSKLTHTVKIPKVITGNKWIVQNDSANTIELSHLLQGAEGDHIIPNAIPSFGDEITIQGYKTDEAGHVIDYPTYKVTIPKGSYNNNEGAGNDSVITGMSFTDSSGAIVTTSQKIGLLKLTGYTLGENDNTIEATDTLNAAIAKLQAQAIRIDTKLASDVSRLEEAIINEAKAREDLGTDLGQLIDDEQAARETADNNINSKIEELQGMDNSLGSAIDEEESARIDAITQVREDFAAADSSINSKIEELSNQLGSAIDEEESTRAEAITQVREDFAAADSAVIAEINNQMNGLSPVATMSIDALYNAILEKLKEEYVLTLKETVTEPTE